MKEEFERSGDALSRGKGWSGIGFAELDGQSWTLPFAAKLLDIPERDLRDMVRITELSPCGVLNLRSYRSQGRAPRAYPAQGLIDICEALADLREKLEISRFA